MMTEQFIYRELGKNNDPQTEYDKYDYTIYSVNHAKHTTKKVKYVVSASVGEMSNLLELVITEMDYAICDVCDYDAVCEALNSLN